MSIAPEASKHGRRGRRVSLMSIHEYGFLVYGKAMYRSLSRLTRKVTVDDRVNRLAYQALEKSAKIISLNQKRRPVTFSSFQLIVFGVDVFIMGLESLQFC